MLDIKFIRENTDLIKRVAKGKRVDIDVDKLLKLDERRREQLHKLEMLKAQHNKSSKGRTGKPSREEIQKMRKHAEEIKIMAEGHRALEEEFEKLLWRVPNIVAADTPKGKDETENKVVRKWGVLPQFDFKPKEHFELGEALDILDFRAAAEVSGARFTYVKGRLALLQFALINFALAVVTDEKYLAKIAKSAKLKVSTKPFVPVIPPVMMRPDVMHKMARLEPREERYHITSDDLYLVGSAEHTLGPLHMNQTLNAAELPLRYVGYSTAFRREAGSYGKDTKGMIRMHQFDKLEMESFTVPEQGIAEQDFLIAIQEYFMQELGLPYQVVFKCIGDMGAPDYREFDIDTWMPGQNKYRETHTADYMADYQARRLNIKFRHSERSEESRPTQNGRDPFGRLRAGSSLALRMTEKDVPHFVHMNDATLLAMSRTPIAIIENYQQKDGTIKVPKILVPYCGFDRIK